MSDDATGPKSGAEARDPALPASRQRRLVTVMRERGQATVTELTALFGVSQDTIRRDLDLLERHGLLTRTHGGAVAGEGMVGRETRYQSRIADQAEAKRRIGRAVAALLRDGETLLLNGGSTTCACAAEMGALRDLTLVTNNFRLPPVVPAGTARAVYLLGGVYWESAQITLGPVRLPGAMRLSVDTAVVGVTGISAEGLSISRLEEATATLEMMEAARRVIVAVNSAKFGNDAFAHIARFDRIDVLVTDAALPAEMAEAVVAAGVEVVVAG